MGTAVMARRKNQNTRVAAIAQAIMEEYQPQTREEMQDAIKDISIPRDRDGSFGTKVIPKSTKDVSGTEDKVLSMYARGMSQRDIADTVEDIYGSDISHETILEECQEGKHTELVREAAVQAEPRIAKWIISSIVDGKTLHAMEIRWELGEAEVMPCCRNSFCAYRKLTLAILNDIKAPVINGK